MAPPSRVDLMLNGKMEGAPPLSAPAAAPRTAGGFELQ
jgi:pilus assembly protein CpaC